VTPQFVCNLQTGLVIDRPERGPLIQQRHGVLLVWRPLQHRSLEAGAWLEKYISNDKD
jgi:hypothetical protein